MARKLSDSEFFAEAARRIGQNTTAEEVKTAWRIMQEYISEELRIYGFIHLPYFGELTANQAGGKMRFIPVGNKPEEAGMVKEVFIEPYLKISFRVCQRMRDLVNGRDVSRNEIFKQREEYKRKKRVEELYLKEKDCMEKAEKALELAEERRRKNIEQRKRAIAKYKRKQANDWFSDEDFTE